MRTFHFALTLCLLSLISAESSQNSVVDFVVTQIGDHERCREGHWLNVFPSSALECAYIVSNNPSCDNRYFSWANYNDNNCLCVDVGTDCKNNLASQNVVTTWEISTDADFSYVRVTANHGTCEDNGMVRITTKEDCTAAAAQLGLPTGSGFASTWSRSNVHGGCIYELDQQDIDFNSNVNNNQVHSDRQVICKSMNAITTSEPTPLEIALVSYWDIGSCGAHGNDDNWEVCGRTEFDCPEMINLDSCPTGRAFKFNEYGTGERGSYIDERGCRYYYYTEYVCESSNPNNLVVTQIGDHERCSEGHWLNVFPSSALECAYIVSDNPSCDNRYFSWANYNDNNCWCAEVGTDCKTNLASQNVVTTWEISTVSSKVINYGECTTINSVPGPPHEFDPENWNTKCPENTAVVSVETKDLEAHNGFWTIVKMRCCALVDKITDSHYRLPEMQTIAGPNYLRGGGSSSVEDQWEAQCGPNAIMVGIYDDDDSGDFDDIDAAKCNTLECPYTCGEKIDSHDCVVIDLSPASLSSCPIDYVMVGLWDNAETNFDCVRKMKCCRVLESILPTVSPTQMPTTDEPSECPTVSPTTSIPSTSPTTNDPTMAPSTDTPTKSPSQNPTTEEPSAFPTKFPTYAPTLCEPTCRSHTDQLVNVLGRLLDFNTQLLRDFEPSHPLKSVLNEMILDVERLKGQMNIVHDDKSIFPSEH